MEGKKQYHVQNKSLNWVQGTSHWMLGILHDLEVVVENVSHTGKYFQIGKSLLPNIFPPQMCLASISKYGRKVLHPGEFTSVGLRSMILEPHWESGPPWLMFCRWQLLSQGQEPGSSDSPQYQRPWGGSPCTDKLMGILAYMTTTGRSGLLWCTYSSLLLERWRQIQIHADLKK